MNEKTGSTELSGHEFNLHSELTFYSYSNLISCLVSDFISASRLLPLSVATFILIEILQK